MSDKPEFIEASFTMTDSTVRFTLEDAMDFLYTMAEKVPGAVIAVGKGLQDGKIPKCPFPRQCDKFPCDDLCCFKIKDTV